MKPKPKEAVIKSEEERIKEGIEVTQLIKKS
jgi:hypothetical protein